MVEIGWLKYFGIEVLGFRGFLFSMANNCCGMGESF